jgi:hypothetical protein
MTKPKPSKIYLTPAKPLFLYLKTVGKENSFLGIQVKIAWENGVKILGQEGASAQILEEKIKVKNG